MSATLIVCFYNRPFYFKPFIDSYLKQSMSVPLLIWNNNPKLKEEVDKLKSDKISVIHSKENIGGFGRFKAAQTIKTEYVIFADDDWELKPNFIAHLYKYRAKRTIAGLWGWNYTKNADGRNRIESGSAQYIGTCGMISDRRIFDRNELYTRILDRPKNTIPMQRDASARNLAMEDLWLSFYARSIGYKVNSCGKLERFARNMNRDASGNLIAKVPGGTNQTWELKPIFIRWMREYFNR